MYLNFDDVNSQPVASGSEGTGIKPFWNYTQSGLGGGWNASVNTSNLNLILNKTLFQIPGRGVPIGESLTYNSQDSSAGPLGMGWHLGSDTSVTEKSDGSVIYMGSDGSVYQFTPASDGKGGYDSPAGIYSKLEKDVAGNFKITDTKLNVSSYPSGKPAYIVDRNKNKTIYSYDANGRLAKLQDPSGRDITYGYDSTGRLTTVTDPGGNVYTLAYAGGRLASVTDPESNTFSFSYYDNGTLNSFTDPLSRVTTFTYNAGKLQSCIDARTNGSDRYETTYEQKQNDPIPTMVTGPDNLPVQIMQESPLVTTVTDPGNRQYMYTSDPSTGNLLTYADQLPDTWRNYTWSNNNQIASENIKGTTSYQYDPRGNLTEETTFIGINPVDSTPITITRTMTYDENNQLIKAVDGRGNTTNYQYDEKGNLLSASNSDLKNSTGMLYNQYGRVTETGPSISTSENLLEDGNFEIGGKKMTGVTGNADSWTRKSGNANVFEGFESHGNYALKMTSSTVTEDYYSQRIMIDSAGSSGIKPGDLLTLRADVKLAGVPVPSDTDGVQINLKYGQGTIDRSSPCYGDGVFSLIVTSQVPDDATYVDVSFGFYNTSGSAWFDGIQLEKALKAEDGYNLSGFNTVENGGFEKGLELNVANKPWKSEDSVVNPGVYALATNVAWGGSQAVKLSLATNGTASIYQDVPVYEGELLTFSGMVKTDNVSIDDIEEDDDEDDEDELDDKGAYFKIEYYNLFRSIDLFKYLACGSNQLYHRNT